MKKFGLNLKRLKDECDRAGLSRDVTFGAAQSLFTEGYISYFRTSSIQIPPEHIPQIKKTIKTLQRVFPELTENKIAYPSADAFPKKFEDPHSAIIPLRQKKKEKMTARKISKELGDDALLVYKIIAQAYLDVASI